MRGRIAIDPKVVEVGEARDRDKDALAEQAYRLKLAPGELSIIPPGWFHTVKALDVTLSVGFHYDPVSNFGHVID